MHHSAGGEDRSHLRKCPDIDRDLWADVDGIVAVRHAQQALIRMAHTVGSTRRIQHIGFVVTATGEDGEAGMDGKVANEILNPLASREGFGKARTTSRHKVKCTGSSG